MAVIVPHSGTSRNGTRPLAPEGAATAPATGNDLGSATGAARFERGGSALGGDAADVRALDVHDRDRRPLAVGPLDAHLLRRVAVELGVRDAHHVTGPVAEVSPRDPLGRHVRPLLLAEQ